MENTYVNPPDKVFLYPRIPLADLRAAETFYGFKEFSFPDKGFLSHYYGRPVPSKGMNTVGAMEANNTLKRIVSFLLLVAKPKRHWLQNVMLQFVRLVDYLYAPHYLHTRYYNDCSRELFQLVFSFLRRLGFNFYLSYSIARIVASLLEFDNGYRLRVEDLFSATTKEKMIHAPRAELTRLEAIYHSRENYKGEEGIEGKFTAVFKGLKLLLLIPKVKKAFRFALVDSEFGNFQLDEIDKYWADRFSAYNFGGEPYGIRQLKQGFKIL